MKLLVAAGFLCLLIISSCSSLSKKDPSQEMQLADVGSARKNESSSLQKNKAEENKKQAPGSVSLADKTIGKSPATITSSDWDKKIIKTANIELKIKDYRIFSEALHTEIKRYGAYISNEQQGESDYKIENTVSIKVPVDQFDNLVNSLNKDDVTIVSKNISAEDVTGEAIDTKARMQSKMAVRDRYTDLLKQAKNMNEVLEIQNEINDIQEDVEAADSRLQYLQHASVYSTINVTYFQLVEAADKQDKPGFINKLADAFSNGTTLIGSVLIALVSLWPLLAIIIITILIFKKWKLSNLFAVKGK